MEEKDMLVTFDSDACRYTSAVKANIITSKVKFSASLYQCKLAKPR